MAADLVWRVTKPGRQIVCRVSELPNDPLRRDGFVPVQLTVAHRGEVFLTEVHKERVRFQQRVEELRRSFEAQGWIAS